MNGKFSKKMLLIGGILLLSMLIFGQPVLALKDEDKPRIFSITCDMETEQILIEGKDFLVEDFVPIVALGGEPLEVYSHTSISIVASLPPSLLAGDYRLSFQFGSSESQIDYYDLTCGAVGPVGMVWRRSPPRVDWRPVLLGLPTS